MTSKLQLDAMLEYERAKTAFSTNAFSGPMNPTIASGASFMPPSTAPSLRAPIAKTAALFKLEGDAVIEVGKDGKSLGKGNVLEKHGALGGKLLRLAATDVPGTPRLLMRQRSPEELAGIEHGYDALVSSFHEPAKRAIEPALQRLPQGKVQDYMRKGVHTLIENPEGLVAWGTGIPGALEGYVGGKKLLEKGIDRFAPAATPRPHGPTILPPPPMSSKTAAGAPTRGGFMMASDVPPLTAPSLRAPIVKQSEGVKAAEAARIAVQEASSALHKVGEALMKVGDSLPDYVTYSPGDFAPAKLNGRPKLSAGQNESIDENAKDGQPEDYKKTASGYPPCPHCGDTTSRLRSIPTRCGKCHEPVAKWKTAAQIDSQYGSDTGADVSSDNYLRGKEKDSDVSPSRTWNPGTGGAQRQESFIPAFHQTTLRSAIEKKADSSGSPFQMAQTAKTVGTFKPGKIPGPSIADIAKPKGSGFGTGIAGAFKPSTGIGGTGPVSMSATPGSLK
jgi:hypothetical protein